MSKADSAVQCFTDGFNCAQAVLSSNSETYGLDKETAYKVSGAFGSGMGQLGETCGAVTGALMLIGLKYGKYKPSDTEAKDRTYACVKQYTNMFKEQYGSIKCEDLIKYDLSKPEQLAEARKAGVFQNICPKLIASSVEMVEKVIGLGI
jgi:C_GCAxxG_C_C family probable redox protein